MFCLIPRQTVVLLVIVNLFIADSTLVASLATFSLNELSSNLVPDKYLLIYVLTNVYSLFIDRSSSFVN